MPEDDEALEIIKTLQSGGYPTEEEDVEKINYLLAFWPGVSNLIFHNDETLSPQEILDKCKKQRPIQL